MKKDAQDTKPITDQDTVKTEETAATFHSVDDILEYYASQQG